MGAGTVGEKAQAEAGLSGALGRFMLVVENYPDLKANENFLALQEELDLARRTRSRFHARATTTRCLFFNNKIQMFPSNIIANTFNFTAGRILRNRRADRKGNTQSEFLDK